MKVGIIGAGLMGQWHCHFGKLSGAQIIGIVDPNTTNAQELARKFSTEASSDLRDFLSKQKPDAVHICTPTGSHYKLIKDCLGAGVHVLVEKPLAGNLPETTELVDMAQQSKLILSPVHQFCFQRGFVALSERHSELGQPVRAGFTTCSSGGDKMGAPDRRQLLLEILPHPLGMFARLFDNMDLDTLKVLNYTNDDLELSLRSDQTLLSVVISLRGRPTRNELFYVGTNGSAHLDLFHGFEIFEHGKVSRHEKILKPFKFGAGVFVKAGTNLAMRAANSESAYPGLKELISRFYQAVEGKSPPPISAREILLVAKVMELVQG